MKNYVALYDLEFLFCIENLDEGKNDPGHICLCEISKTNNRLVITRDGCRGPSSTRARCR